MTEQELSYDPAVPVLGVYLEKNKNSTMKKHTQPNAHSSAIDNSQDIEASPVAKNRPLA